MMNLTQGIEHVISTYEIDPIASKVLNPHDSQLILVKNNLDKNSFFNITYDSLYDEKILQFYAFSQYYDPENSQ
jgi:hypothetical protein